MSSSQSELRFCASSAAMAQLISKVTTARGETEGLIFGTILNRQYRHPTDTDYNAVKHDCLVTVKQVVMTERNAFSNKDNLVDALKLEKVIKDAKADYSPLGWFSCRRDKGAQLTFREKAVIRSFCAGKALMSDFGTLFIRLSLEVTQQSSRHTSQYQAYYGQPNSRKFVSVPFDVVNLGDTSHSDYKSGSSLGLEHIPSAHLNVLNPKQTVQQAVEFREKIESLLDETCAKLKKANRKLDDSLISESSHENWITRILANLPSMEDYNQVVEEEDWYRQQRLDASLVPEGAICQGLDLDLEQSAQSQLSVIPTPNASFQGFDNEETKSDPTDQLFSALEKEYVVL